MNIDDHQFCRVGSRSAARKLAPWAAKIVRVEGGYMAFKYLKDYAEWRRQK